ncbi:MAG: hypothetical protein R3E39_13560 [Anaerolineae bacterium]
MLRWVLANVAGWTVGLSLSTISINSWFVILVASLMFGAVVGAAQRFALQGQLPIRLEQWLQYSLYGGLAGVGVSFILIIPYLLSGDKLLALGIGAIIGTSIGIWQSALIGGSARLWIGANLIGGALCALLTSLQFIRGLPVGLLLGAAVYGYITGVTLQKMYSEASKND